MRLPKRFPSFLKSQAGVSTSEWMIVGALISVLALAAGQVSVYFAQQNKRLEALEMRDRLLQNLTYYVAQTAAVADSASTTLWNGNAINLNLNACMSLATPTVNDCDPTLTSPLVLFEPGHTTDADRPFSHDPAVAATQAYWSSKGERCGTGLTDLTEFCTSELTLQFRPVCPSSGSPCDKAKVLVIEYTLRTKIPGLTNAQYPTGVIETKTGSLTYVVP